MQVFLRFFELRGTKKKKIRARASLLKKKVMGNEYIILPGLREIFQFSAWTFPP